MLHDIKLTPRQFTALVGWADLDEWSADILITAHTDGFIDVGQGDNRVRIHADGRIEDES